MHVFNGPQPKPRGAGPVNVRFENASERVGEIYLYDTIGSGFFGGIGADDFARGLKDLGNIDRLHLFINSEGGDVFQGFAIANQLRRHKATINVMVDGLAASIASVIAMAGDTITMADNAWMMIHNVWGFAGGEADDFRKAADRLDELGNTIANQYATRTGQEVADIRGWMDEETWMNAETAQARGFTDDIEEANAELAASVQSDWFHNIPEVLAAATAQPPADPAPPVEQRVYKSRFSNMDCVLESHGLK